MAGGISFFVPFAGSIPDYVERVRTSTTFSLPPFRSPLIALSRRNGGRDSS